MAENTGAFPVATGTGAYGGSTSYTGNGLGTSGFIPEIWSGKLVEKFYASTVLAAISNTDYEGEIKDFGDTVNIRTKPTITINPYSADQTLSLSRPVGNRLQLAINKGYYFNTILDDVMEVQSDLNNLSMWSDDAAEQIKIQIDTEVLLYLSGQMATNNMGTAAGAISGGINLGLYVSGTASQPLEINPSGTATATGSGTSVSPIDAILRMGQVLDEQNIPEAGRWVVIPAWYATMLKLSELRQVYLSGDSVTMLRNGRLGMIDRFTVYVSNLLPSGTAAGLNAGEYLVYAGHAHGLTFASQVQKVETLRSEMTFGTILRGLQVYGRQVVDGKALVQSVVKQLGAV
jgi:hypothetical protein